MVVLLFALLSEGGGGDDLSVGASSLGWGDWCRHVEEVMEREQAAMRREAAETIDGSVETLCLNSAV